MHRALQFKNAAVSLMLLVPVMLLLVALMTDLARERMSKLQSPDDPPPLLVLSEAQGYTFATGSATPSPALARSLTDSIPQRLALLAKVYSSDLIEVIGHTDGQRVGGKGNLDDLLLSFVHGEGPAPVAGSNVDLGMLRAWEVVRILRSSSVLHGFSFVAYSAGQAVGTDGAVVPGRTSADEPHRRRIEIRLRRRPQ